MKNSESEESLAVGCCFTILRTTTSFSPGCLNVPHLVFASHPYPTALYLYVRFLDGDTAPGGGRVPEHCPISTLQAHGGGAIPRLAFESERFVAVLSELAVELPASRGSVPDPATARGARDYVYERWIRTRDT